MPVYRGGRDGAAGIKWISVYPDNPKRGLPSVIGHLLLNDVNTGDLLALMQASLLTAYRTGAAGAVASKALARPDSRVFGLVGAGVQAGYQLLCHLEYFKFSRVCVWSPYREEVDSFVKRFRSECPALEAAGSLKECVETADILSTCTPSRKPIIRTVWVRPGTHVNAIGADAPGKQECESLLLKKASIYVDDWQQASHSGEINVPFSRGVLSHKDVKGTLTDAVLCGIPRKQGEITLFDSTGLAVQDIFVAKYVYDQARKTPHRYLS